MCSAGRAFRPVGCLIEATRQSGGSFAHLERIDAVEEDRRGSTKVQSLGIFNALHELALNARFLAHRHERSAYVLLGTRDVRAIGRVSDRDMHMGSLDPPPNWKVKR